MKSRHVIKQGLRCLHGVLCLKLCYHYSSGKAARQYHGNGAADSVVLGSGYRNCSVACRLARAVAQQPPAVNGQDERFAPLTAAARRAFWQTRRAGTDCACPPIHILAIVDIGFSTGVVVGCAPLQGVPAAIVYRLSSRGRHSPTRFRWDGMSELRS